MTGKIKTLPSGKNYGFILGEDGNDYFFHAGALKNTTMEELKKGDEVMFEDSKSDKGTRAEDIYV